MTDVGLAFYGIGHVRDWRWLWLRRRKVRELQGLMHVVPEGVWMDMVITLRAQDEAVEVDMISLTEN